MFKSTVKHAYENTVFYHRMYREHGIRPEDIRSLDDIEMLPTVSKQDLRQCSIEDRFSRSFDIRKCAEAKTSGSTGEPFRVYSEPYARSYLWALHLRRLFTYSYKAWYTIVTFGPFWAASYPTIGETPIRKGFMNVVAGFDANRHSLLDEPQKNISYLRAIRPDVIWSPPSYLRLLAQTVHKLGIEDIGPRIIVCGAEILDRKTRTLIESTFQVKVFDEYGTRDVASRAIAWQCDRHDGYHINIDAVYPEFVKDGEPVSPGEEGQILATNLFRYATPMIRYSTGDVGTSSREPCSCGRSFPLMESIIGRCDDYLVMPDRNLISPFVVMSLIHDFQGVQKYQVVQEKVDKVIIFLELLPGCDDVAEAIRSKSSKLFDDEVQIELVLGPITVVKGRKHRTVVSRVPHALKQQRPF